MRRTRLVVLTALTVAAAGGSLLGVDFLEFDLPDGPLGPGEAALGAMTARRTVLRPPTVGAVLAALGK